MTVPPRDATERYLATTGRQLDITFDVDLGELVPGHHVVARGIEHALAVDVPIVDLDQLRLPNERSAEGDNEGGFVTATSWEAANVRTETRMTEAQLHYEFVPGIAPGECEQRGEFFWYWMLQAHDDVGTEYNANNGGGFDGQSGGTASHGSRDLGGQVPATATRLTIRFDPPSQWWPPEPWIDELTIDLLTGRVLSDQ